MRQPISLTRRWSTTIPGTTDWVAYNRFIGINDTTSWINGDTVPVRNAGPDGTPSPTDAFDLTRLADAGPPSCLMKTDPRATRFGIFQMDTNPASTARITDPLWPSGSAALPNGYGGNIADPGGPVEHAPNRFSSAAYYPATFSINPTNGLPDAPRDTAVTTYADNDGVTRPADAIYPGAATSTGSSTPYYTTSTSYHPIILNRPFRNVAELGYVFRDLPWKTLDFFTEKSADAGLLDIFTINDGAPVLDGSDPPNIIGMAPPTMAAGSVNLNTTQAADLQAVFADAILDEAASPRTQVSGTDTGAATDAPTLASHVVTATSTTPMQNKSELITRVDPVTGVKLVETILPPGPNDDQAVKTRREVVARAASSVSQTRVWNLLIDLVAQTGHYPPNAQGLDDFVVEGEKRYWLHVAIDRFEGSGAAVKVLGQQLEEVTE